HYFMMGDNRDNSLDSRWPEEIGVGYVPAENIVGKARVVLISWKEGASFFKPWTWLNLNWGRTFKGIH
ncbi:MAG TPA: S26 family signal peptidase, partial [Phenylobacterium sp.]|nr:S26 family signal peptidase [Phenylobacterium sp.]